MVISREFIVPCIHGPWKDKKELKILYHFFFNWETPLERQFRDHAISLSQRRILILPKDSMSQSRILSSHEGFILHILWWGDISLMIVEFFRQENSWVLISILLHWHPINDPAHPKAKGIVLWDEWLFI